MIEYPRYSFSYNFITELLKSAPQFLRIAEECVADDKKLEKYVQTRYGLYYEDETTESNIEYNKYVARNMAYLKGENLKCFRQLIENNKEYSAIKSHYMVYCLLYEVVLENSEKFFCRFEDIRMENGNYVCECIDILHRDPIVTYKLIKSDVERRTIIISPTTKISVKNDERRL